MRLTATRLPLFLVAFASGCSSEPPLAEPLPGRGAVLTLEVSRADAPAGDTVVVALRSGRTARIGGIQGRLRYDRTRLRLLGQDPTQRSLVALNPADTAAGEVRFLALDPAGLDVRGLVLGFVVRAPGYMAGLEVHDLIVAGPDAEARHAPARITATPTIEPLRLAGARFQRSEEWAQARMPAGDVLPRAHVAGEYRSDLRYGDATLSGGLNVLDAAYVANVAVGIFPLIAGTDSPSRDAVVAANVRPINGAGLGEVTDPVPPGREADGRQLINVLDAVAIANEAVGNDQAIVGLPIPGRAPVSAARLVVSGDITSDVTWPAGTLVELHDTVKVRNGATLTIEAGTRLEGASVGSQLVITRTGRLLASGTLLEPIVFSCTHAATPCLGGLVVQGNAPVLGGTPTSPPARGTGASGCAELPSGMGPFGGCDAGDSSGVLRYVRVEHSATGLRLEGVGRATVIDFVQAEAVGPAVTASGGTADLKHLVADGLGNAGFHWADGWSGRLQFGLLRGGLDGDAPPGAASPTLHNLTLLGLSAPAIRLTGEAGARIGNALTLDGGIALSLPNGAATCAQITAGTLAYHHSAWAGVTTGGDPDTDAAPCAGYASPNVEAAWFSDPANANLSLPSSAGLLEHPVFSATPDFRPPPGGTLASAVGAAPVADGFFDVTATYIGAVRPGSLLPEVPWHAGWTGPGATGPVAGGTLTGTVSSTLLGPLNGVTISSGAGATATAADGSFTLAGVPAGGLTVTVGNLPVGCTAPGSRTGYVPTGGAGALAIEVTCSAPAGAFTVDIDVAGQLGTAHLLRPATGRLRTAFSLLGSDAVTMTVSNVFASPVGAYVAGKVRVWFDLTLTSTLNGIALVPPTWPVPPPGQTGIFVFPYAATAFTTSGGILTLLPNSGQVVASVDWNGDASPDRPAAPGLPGSGGSPWSWFNDPSCGAPPAGGASDCYRYETFPPLGVLATSPARRVGFDIDPSVGNFRAYLLVAADISQP